jgi:putative SOS response-associated peptidase YedK
MFEQIRSLLLSENGFLRKPYDARPMRCYPVSTPVNHVANDDEECSAPVEFTETQSRLFL